MIDEILDELRECIELVADAKQQSTRHASRTCTSCATVHTGSSRRSSQRRSDRGGRLERLEELEAPPVSPPTPPRIDVFSAWMGGCLE
jgi:hypothetical protein